MKVVILFALLAVASALPSSYKWHEFKQNFQKTYPTVEEEIKRAKIYLNNVKLINEHNQRYENGEVDFQLGVNKFADLTLEEFKQSYTGFKGTKHQTGSVLTPKSNDLPSSVDWRTKGIVAPVKDQGQCGSCWAFSAVASMEAVHAQRTGKLIELSEQNLMDCSGPEGDMSCNGGLMDFAFQYVLDNKGIDTENTYPYEGHDDTCRFKNSDIGATIKSYVNITGGDEKSLQVASTEAVVSVAIEVNFFFQFYFGGVFHSKCGVPAKLDHGVAIVGYGSENGKDYWIVRNSWGGSWGEKGYIRMLRGANLCGISDSASYPVA